MARNRGSIQARGDNKWLLRVFLGMTPEGKREYSAKTFEGTFSQAGKELTAMLRENDTDMFVQPSKLSLKEYLEGWLKSKIDVAERTVVSYTQKLAYVIARIGHLMLHEVDARAVQSFVTNMNESGLSPRSIEYAHRVLHIALEDAIRQHLLVRNPCDHTKLPKKIKRAPTVLTMKQVGTLLAKTADDSLQALWMLLLTSGLRPQEALALKWSDLDIEGKWLSVQRNLVDNGHGVFSLADVPKADSYRRIGLPESTVALLQKHKVRQNAEVLLGGPDYDRADLIFANSVGHYTDPNLVRRRWKAALKAAGLPSVRLYDTRHTHLTALLANGADLAWVAARAGHKDIKMTQQHYAHVMPETHRGMGDMTERMLKEASK